MAARRHCRYRVFSRPLAPHSLGSLTPASTALLHCGALFHFFGRDIFDVRGKRPGMAEGIFQNAYSVAVKLVGHWPQKLGAFRRGAADQRIHVFDLDENIDRRAAERGRAQEIHFWKFVGEHDRRHADAQLGVTDAAVRQLDTHHFARAESVLVIFNCPRRSFHAQVRRRAAIFVWNWVDLPVMGPPSVEAFANRPRQPRRLKYCTACSCFSATRRLGNVPRFRRLPVFGFTFRE